MTTSIRPYLEYQAGRAEAVLAAHRTPGRITGGTVGPVNITFHLLPAPHIRFNSYQALHTDIALALQVHSLSLTPGNGYINLTFPNPNPSAIDLKALLDEIGTVPFCTALLGITDAGNIQLVRLSSPNNPHALISGTTGSGKSTLLQTIAASLALNNTPRLLQLLLIDPKGRTFTDFANLPHLTRPPIQNPASAAEALHSLLKVMQTRDERHTRPDYDAPRIVVLIDELADLIMEDSSATETITRLVQRGREAGIHVVAATQHPSAAILGSLMRANFPLRIVGKVVSADDARVASGRAGTNAHLLNGRGDFVAVSGGTTARFQAPFARNLENILKTVDYTPINAIHINTVNATLQEKPKPRPASTETKAAPGERVAEALEILRPLWPELRPDWLRNRWGIKTECVQLVWPNQRYEGSFAGWIEDTVNILENEYVATLREE